jgi:LacI family transcriptional regulator
MRSIAQIQPTSAGPGRYRGRVDRRPTISDVAQLAGVHRSTAARALSPSASGMLKPETVTRVARAAERLGYSTNTLARGLRTSRSQTVGVLLPDLNNPLFPPIVRGIEDALLPRGYTALIASTDNDAERERIYFHALLSRQVDGFIIATARDQDCVLDEAGARGIAVVLVNRTDTARGFPMVTGDDREGVRAAVRHLADLGHRRIVHLAGPDGVSSATTRRSAFRETIADLAIPAEDAPVLPCSAFTEDAGRSAAEQILARSPRPTAIFAANDLIALGALRAIRAHGLSCPQDISVVGFNDMRFADAFDPPLTTVHVPHQLMGAEAGRLLLDQLGLPEPVGKSILLPLTLAVRASTGPAPS